MYNIILEDFWLIKTIVADGHFVRFYRVCCRSIKGYFDVLNAVEPRLGAKNTRNYLLKGSKAEPQAASSRSQFPLEYWVSFNKLPQGRAIVQILAGEQDNIGTTSVTAL